MSKNLSRYSSKSRPSYTAWMSFTLLMILAFAFIAICCYKLLESNDNYRVLSEINASVKSSLIELATHVDSLTATINGIAGQPEVTAAGDIPVFATQAKDAVKTINDRITTQVSPLTDALSIMQGQYDQFTGYLNFLFNVLAAILTIITVAIPIMNYNYLQKDQIERMNRQYEELKNRMDGDLTRMQKATEQATQISSEIAVTDKTEANEINPISDNPLDIAQAAYINAQILVGRKNLREALSKIEIAVNLAPNNAVYRHGRGTILHELKLYEDALKDKNEAVRLDPQNAKYFASRGTTLHDMKRYEDALKDKNEALRLEPNNVLYLNNRGVTLFDMKRYDDALKDFNDAIRLDPHNAKWLHNRGIALTKLRRYEDALKDYNDAVHLEPNNADIHNSLSNTFFDMRRYEDALNCGNEAVRLEPGNAQYLNNRSGTFRSLKRYNEALIDANRAYEIEPDNANYLASVGAALYRLNQIQTALEYINRSVQIDVSNALAYRYRGLCTLKLINDGKQEYSHAAALSDLSKAISLENDNKYNYLARAEYYIIQKDFANALTDLNDALRLDVFDPTTYHLFEVIYQAIGDTAEAEKYHRLAIEHGYIPAQEER